MKLDMTRGAFHATLFLFTFTLVLFAANLLFTAHEINSVRASEAASARATASVTQLCQLGNEARAQQIGLWEYVIHLSKKPQTAQQRAVVARFEQHLHVIFRPRNCRAVARSQP